MEIQGLRRNGKRFESAGIAGILAVLGIGLACNLGLCGMLSSHGWGVSTFESFFAGQTRSARVDRNPPSTSEKTAVGSTKTVGLRLSRKRCQFQEMENVRGNVELGSLPQSRRHYRFRKMEEKPARSRRFSTAIDLL